MIDYYNSLDELSTELGIKIHYIWDKGNKIRYVLGEINDEIKIFKLRYNKSQYSVINTYEGERLIAIKEYLNKLSQKYVRNLNHKYKNINYHIPL